MCEALIVFNFEFCVFELPVNLSLNSLSHGRLRLYLSRYILIKWTLLFLTQCSPKCCTREILMVKMFLEAQMGPCLPLSTHLWYQSLAQLAPVRFCSHQGVRMTLTLCSHVYWTLPWVKCALEIKDILSVMTGNLISNSNHWTWNCSSLIKHMPKSNHKHFALRYDVRLTFRATAV